MKTLAERLSWARAQKRMTQGELARQSGVTQSTIGNLESGLRLSARRITNIAEALGVDALWLSEGRGEPTARPATDAANDPSSLRGVVQVEVVDDDSPEFVQVPLIQLRLSAGLTGFQADPEYHDGSRLSLSRQWIEEKRLNPRSLIALKVKGDSMIPNLYHGDTVVVNTADRKMVDGAVFAVNFEGEAVIKRLERKGGMWYLASDNTLLPQYKPRLVRDNEAIIVGRVVKRETDQI